MTRTESSREIDDAAALWAARMDRGPLGEIDQIALNAWLDGDNRRLGALTRAQAMLVPLQQPEQKPILERLGLASIASRISRRRIWELAAVTALVAAVGGVTLLPRGADSYDTARGEVRLFPLADGSIVTLNTKSRIKVDFTNSRRTVYLVEGEGLFDVAKDPDRPFFVEAGVANVRAIGTAFTVRRTGKAPVQVFVQHGVVEVAAPAGRKEPVVLKANMKATATGDVAGTITSAQMSSDEIERSLAWREGKIAFSGTQLVDAVAEFNRYNKVKLKVGDQAAAARTMTGLFASTDPRGFARAAALSLDLHVRETPELIVLY